MTSERRFRRSFSRKSLLEKSFSVNMLEKPKKMDSSCSLDNRSVYLPCIDSSTRTKRLSVSKSMSVISRKNPETTVEDDETSPFSISIETVSSPHSFGGCFLSSGFRRDDANATDFEIVGPSACQTSFEVPLTAISDRAILVDQTELEEDKALANWKRWMEIRKRQNVIFSDRLKRDKCDLVMNRNENHRKKLEEKELLMQAQIPDEDRWRGDPKFWKAPAKLPRKGMKNKYYARKMLMEEGILPKFESISVPDEVKMEKDVFCRESESRVDLWERSVYRRQQRVKFAKKIERLSPCKPEAENLIVIGKKILPPLLEESSENRDLPSIIITRAEEEEEVIDSDVVLNINGVELKLNEFGEVCSSNENAAWFVIFDACSIGRITEQSLPIENKGTVAIRYEWHHYIADCPEIPWRKVNFLERPFFFNKNPGVFLPGQKCDMKFYHYSNHPGFHTETWCLNLWPNLLGGGKPAKVTLTAVVENVFSTRDYKKVDQYLSFCARDSIIRDILNDVIDRVGRYVPRTLEYASFFTEEELFEFQNPSHYYRYSIVEQLKSMFEEIPFFRPRTWDFNLFTLEDLIRSYVDYEQQREMLCKLMNLTRALLRPERLNYKFDKKFKMVYNALCSVIDAMEINIVAIKDMYLKLEEQEFRGIDADVIPIPSDSASHYSVITSILTDDTISRDTLIADFRIGYKNMPAYRHNLYTTFYHFLGEAAETAAGIIETCKLFEHHGELLMTENVNFMFERNEINEN